MALQIGPCVRCGSQATGKGIETWSLRDEGWLCDSCCPEEPRGTPAVRTRALKDYDFIGVFIPRIGLPGYPLKCHLCETDISPTEKAFAYWDGYEDEMVLNCPKCEENPERIKPCPPTKS